MQKNVILSYVVKSLIFKRSLISLKMEFNILILSYKAQKLNYFNYFVSKTIYRL